MIKIQGIYKITNKLNGKVYIGQSNDIERRLKEHKQKRFIPIDMWINMIGVENFDFEVIESCSSDELDEKEKLYIEKYNSIKEGYNFAKGGNNNSKGEGNGRARLTKEDVKIIRQAYNEHKSQKEVYGQFKDKTSFNNFQSIWRGATWVDVMPEVYTEENKNYYKTSGASKQKISIPLDKLLYYRQYYVDHTFEETWKKFLQENVDNKIKKQTFQKILIGDVRLTSTYNTVPVYSKKNKIWEIKGEPVTTILESEK